MHSTPVYKWKIQWRRKPGKNRWHDLHAFGRMVLFDLTQVDNAVEYMRQVRFPGVMKSGELVKIMQEKKK